MTKVKRALLIFPNDTLLSYDLMAIDLVNQWRTKLGDKFETATQILLDCFVKECSPFHKVYKKEDGSLAIMDLTTRKEPTYDSLCKFISCKPGPNLTKDFYTWIVDNGFSYLIRNTTPSLININSKKELLDNFSNFIVAENVDEQLLMERLFGNPDQIILRKDLANWLIKHTDIKEDAGIIISTMSRNYDIDEELNELIDPVMQKNIDLADYIQIELRMVLVSVENLPLYKRDKETQGYFDRSSLGLFPLFAPGAKFGK